MFKKYRESQNKNKNLKKVLGPLLHFSQTKEISFKGPSTFFKFEFLF
jgi:hypothetical protein